MIIRNISEVSFILFWSVEMIKKVKILASLQTKRVENDSLCSVLVMPVFKFRNLLFYMYLPNCKCMRHQKEHEPEQFSKKRAPMESQFCTLSLQRPQLLFWYYFTDFLSGQTVFPHSKVHHRDPPGPITWENIFSAFAFSLPGEGNEACLCYEEAVARDTRDSQTCS